MGGDQVKEINEGAHVMIGTPGRVYDIITNRAGPQCVSNLKTIVLDEADEMLSVGFKDQVREIFLVSPQDAQICLFSATLNPDVMGLTKKFMRDPIEILVETENLTLDGIKQFYVKLREQDKFGCLMDLYQSMAISQCLIYCNSRGRVEEVSAELIKNGFTVGGIHGQMAWDEREKVMEEFRSGRLRVLIATDLLARGIDVQQVSIVINYDIPRDVANYLHRIGRSGRFGRKGVGINFVTEASWETLDAIRTHYKTEINELPMDYQTYL
jgi:translation initiation factor 4A